MLVRMDVHVEGEERYIRGFQMMRSDARDLSRPLREVGEDIRQGVGDQFLTEGSSRGTPWAPLSEKYAEWKDVHYPGMPILVATSRMRSEMLSPLALHVTPSKMVYDPDNDLAPFHQFGTVHMPARKMLVIRPTDKRRWDRIFHEWINYLKHRHMGLG